MLIVYEGKSHATCQRPRHVSNAIASAEFSMRSVRANASFLVRVQNPSTLDHRYRTHPAARFRLVKAPLPTNASAALPLLG